MLAFAYYLIKITLASAILYGYYWLALRNRLFHQWNRFYLLASLVLSLVLPLIRINIQHKHETSGSQVIQLLQVVTTSDEFVEKSSLQPASIYQAGPWIVIAYVLLADLVLGGLMISLIRISKLIRNHPQQELNDIRFVNTLARGTPFSFFRYIFWNQNIDLQSCTGQHIFRHELAHVREKHSLDKLFINILLIPFWANPVFWLMRRELGLVHEFIADQKSVEQNDTRAFAAMILQTAYPQQHLPLTNAFFYSPLKRRLLMLTKIQNPKFSYLSRLMALPLAALVFAAFTLKPRSITEEVLASSPAEERAITVMIDPGHGGEDNGAMASDGTREKDINLAIALKIQKLNPYKNINIILTREKDENLNVKERVLLAQHAHVDAYISIHTNTNPDAKQHNSDSEPGVQFYVSAKPQVYAGFTKLLGTLASEEIGKVFKTDPQLKQNADRGIWVLDAPEINYPSLLIEFGNMSVPEDLKFISSEKNQEDIASSILNSVNRYAASPRPKLEVDGKGISFQITDSSAPKNLPEDIKSIGYAVDGNVIAIFKDGHTEKMSVEYARQKGYFSASSPATRDTNKVRNCLFIIDGKEMSQGFDLNKLEPGDIKSIQVLKDQTAVSLYGEKGKNGVLIITTKAKQGKRIDQESAKPRKNLGINFRNPFNKESNPNILNEANS